MDLPFTTDQFLNVFKIYNELIYPIQLFAYANGIFCLYAIFSKANNLSRLIFLILGAFWLWMGVFYHLLSFSAINNAAIGFGILFILQGIIFLYFGFRHPDTEIKYRNDIRGIAGLILIAYSMVIYSLIGYSVGHVYPYSPVFGVAPCPTAVFTFGLLLQIRTKFSWWVMVIPLIWSIIGFSAVMKMGMAEDIGLLVSALIAMGLLIRDKKSNYSEESDRISEAEEISPLG